MTKYNIPTSAAARMIGWKTKRLTKEASAGRFTFVKKRGGRRYFNEARLFADFEKAKMGDAALIKRNRERIERDEAEAMARRKSGKPWSWRENVLEGQVRR